MKKIKRNKLQRALVEALGSGVALALFATAAHAQQPQKGEKIEVTGSNIKRVDTEGPAPVQVITRDEILKSGQRDLAELLRGISAASAGSQLDQTSNSFSNGAQTVSLRGLGSAATLLLVNGRRLTPSAYADPNTGNSTVYNLNAIPLDAIERIEVLKDGASAIYGSDAMAGVVNIILRRDYRGGEASASYSTNRDRMWTNYRGAATLGFGDLSKDKFNVLGSFEHYHRDPVNIKELKNVPVEDLVRLGAWRTTQSANGFPANYFRENVLGNGNFNTFVAFDRNCPAQQVIANRCRYDLYNDVNNSFKQDRDSAYFRGTWDVLPHLSAFGEFMYSRVKSDYFSTPPSFSNVISVWGTATGSLRQYRLILPVGHPDNPTTVPVAAAYTFSDVGRRTSLQTNETYRTLLGLKGTAAGWDFETGLLRMSNQREDQNGGYLYFPSLQAAVNDRSYRVDGRTNSPEVLARVGTTFAEEGEATVTSWDLRASKELFQMAGGPFAIAAGLEARKEEMKISPDAKIIAGDIVGRGTTAADGDRNVTAFYAEVAVPFMKGLETQLALRTEHYSDFGNSTTPKVGVKWLAAPELALRGTWAKGFRAPALTQISESSVQAFNNGVRDPLRCPTFDATNRDCSTSFASYIKANPDLKPEKSDNFTAGFIFSPTRNASVSVDYWNIRRKDQIDRFSSTYILAREAQFPGAIVRDPNPATWLPGVPNSGPIFAANRQFFNLAETKTSGIDIDASLLNNLGEAGKLNTTFNGTYLISYKYAVAKTDPLVEQAGTIGGPSDALPRFRGNIASTWSRGPYAVTSRINYVRGWFNGGGGTATQGGGCFFSPNQLIDPSCRVKPWTTWDLGFVYSGIKNLDISLLVRNVQDKTAPFDANYELTTFNGFNPVFHNALGRYFTVGLRYTFL
jgi:iron complex outermembrane receptor protein